LSEGFGCSTTLVYYPALLRSITLFWSFVPVSLSLTRPGTFDFICNHIGNEMWMNKLEWTGHKGFNDAEFVDWKVKGEVAGSYKTYDNLTVSYSSFRCPPRLRQSGMWLMATAAQSALRRAYGAV
jgi:hypothetical protein